MPFCSKCGKQVGENARFCPVCGNPIGAAKTTQSAGGAPVTAPAPSSAPAAAPAQNVNVAQNNAGEMFDRQFAGVTVRYRCGNGHVFNGTARQTSCPTCGATLPKGGYIQIYRMGNMMGAAVGMGIYVDGVPYGHVANKQSVRVSVPYGTHVLHMAHTATRDSNKPQFMLSPQYPYVFFKAHFSNAGFSIGIDQADPQSMPLK